jgi:hypothetical protein
MAQPRRGFRVLVCPPGAVVSTVSALRAVREAGMRREAEGRALAERDAALWQTYIADIAAGFGALQTGETQLLKTRLASAPEMHRGWEWSLLHGLADASLRSIQAHDDMIFAFAVSRDGARLATGSRDGRMCV